MADPARPDPETKDLHAKQAEREAKELRQAAEADTGEETRSTPVVRTRPAI